MSQSTIIQSCWDASSWVEPVQCNFLNEPLFLIAKVDGFPLQKYTFLLSHIIFVSRNNVLATKYIVSINVNQCVDHRHICKVFEKVISS